MDQKQGSNELGQERRTLWPRYDHEYAGRVKAVVGVGEAHSPPVIVLHELAGLGPQTMEFAQFLADSGFRVHLPRLFGAEDQESMPKGFVQLCISREITLLVSNRTSPVSDWIRSLCRRIASEGSRPNVGIVGMCVTGGLVFSTMWEQVVQAAVASQPSAPFRLKFSKPNVKDLGSSEVDVERAVASGTPLLVFRFKRDWICPASRLVAIDRRFGDQAQIVNLEGKGHSTLVFDRDRAPNARLQLVAFLTEQLS